MSTVTSIPTDYQKANPLLYTFRDYHTGIQPYFVIAAQFLIFDFSLRIWDKAVYDTWLLPMEFIEIEEEDEVDEEEKTRRISTQQIRTNSNGFFVSTILILQEMKGFSLKTKKREKLPTFDLFDILFSCLPLIAHTIWYCIIQTNCSSGDNASTWNCYNLFGYRIYNYLFDPFTSFAYTFLSKLYLYHINRKEIQRMNERKKSWRRILSKVIFYIALGLSLLTFLLVGALVLPYFFTNALPMIIIYCFIVFTYVYIFTVVNMLLKCYTITTGRVFSLENENLNFFKRQIIKLHYNRFLFIQTSLRLFPYLMSILFNLSQYFYYGENFWDALSREATSRDPSPYFTRVTNSAQIVHTILSTI
ncbi:hypothetical protein I4U23_005854 [Adineta vaga]|nr:hypothetical protein I4U23_005854 [Adineta vaga]